MATIDKGVRGADPQIANFPVLFSWAISLLVGVYLVITVGTLTAVPDSASYLDNSPVRTATYPLFLDITGPYALHIQVGLFVIGTGALCQELAKWLRTPALPVGLSLSIALNPKLWELQTSILSEALSVPLLMLFLAALMRAARSRGGRALILAALLAGISAAVRPSLIVMGLVPIIAILLLRLRGPLLLACTAMWLAPIVIDNAYNRHVHGEGLTSLLGRHLYAKGALIDAAPQFEFDNHLEAKLALLAEKEYSSRRRDLGQAIGIELIDKLNEHEGCIQYACTDVHMPKHVSMSSIHDAMFKVGLARVLDNPLALIPITFTEYVGHWRTDPAGSFIVQFIVILIGFAFTGATIILLGASFYKNMFARYGLLTALTVQFVLAFNSVAGIGNIRYAVGLWPAIILTIFLALFVLVRALRGASG